MLHNNYAVSRGSVYKMAHCLWKGLGLEVVLTSDISCYGTGALDSVIQTTNFVSQIGQ